MYKIRLMIMLPTIILFITITPLWSKVSTITIYHDHPITGTDHDKVIFECNDCLSRDNIITAKIGSNMFVEIIK